MKKAIQLIVSGLLAAQTSFAAITVDCTIVLPPADADFIHGPAPLLVRSINERSWNVASQELFESGQDWVRAGGHHSGGWNMYVVRVDANPVQTGTYLIDRMTYRNGGIGMGELMQTDRYSCNVTITDDDGDVAMNGMLVD